MSNLSDLEIRAADAILQTGNDVKNMPINYCLGLPKHSDISEVILNYMARILDEEGFIKLSNQDDSLLYTVKPKAHKYATLGKSYADFLQEEAEKQAKVDEKEKLDEKIKDLQHQELQQKVEHINPGQLQFWKDLAIRHWQLTLLAMGTLIVALFKALGVF